MAYAAPGRAEIARVIPAGSVRLRSPRIEALFLAELGADPRLLALRSDGRASMLEFAKWLGRGASHADGTFWRTREWLCERAGRSESTWKACRRRLAAWGYLPTVRQGSTPQLGTRAAMRFRRWRTFRGEQVEGNEAPVYVLCVPRKHAFRRRVSGAFLLTRPPTTDRREVVDRPARARQNQDQDQGREGPRSARAVPPAVARALRKGPGKSLTDRHVRWIARRHLAAGYSAADLAHAVEHEPPPGGPHRYAYRNADVRHPAGWLASRLSRWLGDDGQVLPSRSQASAARRERDRAGLAGILAGGAGWADPKPYAAAIRRQQGWHGEPKGKPAVRWIQYPDEASRRHRRHGRRREGQVWQEGPAPGTIWAVPVDVADRLYVLVHYYPAAPEDNYALDTPEAAP